jgi:hypothetical protein
VLGNVILCPFVVQTCKNDDNEDLKDEDSVKHLVHFLHNITDLMWRFLKVLENLSVHARIYNNSISKFGVSYK